MFRCCRCFSIQKYRCIVCYTLPFYHFPVFSDTSFEVARECESFFTRENLQNQFFYLLFFFFFLFSLALARQNKHNRFCSFHPWGSHLLAINVFMTCAYCFTHGFMSIYWSEGILMAFAVEEHLYVSNLAFGMDSLFLGAVCVSHPNSVMLAVTERCGERGRQCLCVHRMTKNWQAACPVAGDGWEGWQPHVVPGSLIILISLHLI